MRETIRLGLLTHWGWKKKRKDATRAAYSSVELRPETPCQGVFVVFSAGSVLGKFYLVLVLQWRYPLAALPLVFVQEHLHSLNSNASKKTTVSETNGPTMIKHCYYLPSLIILSSLFGLIPTVANIVEYGTSRPFMPPIGQGFLVGVILFIVCTRWIRKSQSDGVVYLGWGSELIILFYVASTVAIAWLLYTRVSWICFLLVASEPNQCAIAFSAFRSSTELAFLVGIYVWGLGYERRTRSSLRYRMAFIESGPGIARGKKMRKEE